MSDKEEANSYEEENKEHKIVIHLAGGITENADITNVNLAYVLEDGMKIVIPNINEKTSSST